MRLLLQEIKRIKVVHLLGLFFLVLPFSHIFWRSIPIWWAQNRFFHMGVLIIFGYSLFMPSKKENLPNFPLALLFIWLTFITSQWWYAVFINDKQYAVLTLLPYLSFLFAILLYKLIVDYLNKNHIIKILNIFSMAISAISVYGIIQFFNLDQFYKHFNTSDMPDSVVGILGNPTHFGIYLATCLPILYYTKTKISTISILISWVVILFTNSISALIIAAIVTIIYSLYFQIRHKWEKIIGGILLFLPIFIILIKKINLLWYISPSGRIDFWKELLPLFKKYPITGSGLGRLQGILLQRMGTSFQGWGHAHNEFLQIMVEGGLIALILVLGCIAHYFLTFKRIEKTELSVCLMTIFTGFLLSSLVSYPAHLAVPATLGMFSYAGIYVINGDKI